MTVHLSIRVVDNAFNRPLILLGCTSRSLLGRRVVSFDLNSIFRDDDQFFAIF